ncbi:putative ditrans,polycis-polyprenyl diphosphate synthase ((2E,6E)-farnesyl diphosphate specific) [Helianthus annuus]|nr:putative ditrans,polycis-polyprenyl diphosphate synthase ((2E,6E)-farnesyl diphosphate specific) [Helianthus annuus]
MAPSILIAEEEDSVAELKYQALYDGLQAELLPTQVAIMFMDGASGDQLNDIARICCELRIKVLSVSTLSSASVHRSKEEIDVATNITKLCLEDLERNDIRVSVIGKRDSISDSLLDMITKMEETTKNNKSLHIIEAIDYTGRGEIIQACVALAGKVKDGVIQPEDIDENVFQQELETKCSEFPDPDIMIRTGGKYSIDNFMIWQMAYTELYFVEKDDLEFNKTSFVEALDSYQKRSRRFGGK